MKKAEFIALVAENLDSTKAEAENALDALVKSIVSSVQKDEEVSIAGLGKFSLAVRNARTGINPKTKEKIHIASKNVVKFKVAKSFKEIV